MKTKNPLTRLPFANAYANIRILKDWSSIHSQVKAIDRLAYKMLHLVALNSKEVEDYEMPEMSKREPGGSQVL